MNQLELDLQYFDILGWIFGASTLLYVIISIIASDLFFKSSPKIDAKLINMSLQKSEFVLKDQIQVHPFFEQGVSSIILLVRKINIRLTISSLICLLGSTPIIGYLIWLAVNEIVVFVFTVLSWIIIIATVVLSTILLSFAIFRNIKIQKLKLLLENIIVNEKALLFDVNLDQIPDHFQENNTNSVFTNYLHKLTLNEQIITKKFHKTKDHGQSVLYLMFVYSNYKNQKFYSPKYHENMKYFLEKFSKLNKQNNNNKKD
ncbi:hypothetical protein NPA08_03765 [Mycoplasmopsis citelli]|uniref:hypothetical protein n=1 Tax=Mycoplasmopsis citelli TaxID=171281 RepID=UPI0021146D47|nr:hypothetical protein [Mycoplasmopsis citelli]UUD36044.1 hypothetical protein NPA08_03765 [Mycoplasmopsis citelli]